MEYQKPELVLIGKAVDVIESSLTKGPIPNDGGSNSGMTNAAAYEADE